MDSIDNFEFILNFLLYFEIQTPQHTRKEKHSLVLQITKL